VLRAGVFEQEVLALRTELDAMGAGGLTGNAHADSVIRGWVPEVLPPQ
jgi:hypothetical protein